MRPLTRLWLAEPTRFAALRRAPARRVLAFLALLLIAAVLAAGIAPSPPPIGTDAETTADDRADLALYDGVVAAVAHGEDYYRSVVAAHRAGGYPLRPFVTVRLPTLAVVQAALPPAVTLWLLWSLALVVIVAWWTRLAQLFRRRAPRLIAVALLAGGCVMLVQPELMTFHEPWAALLIALSLAVRRPGRWVEAVALGLSAALIRETALVYLLTMGALAWRDGERREALGWAGVIAMLALVLALHAHALAQLTGPLDHESQGWAGFGGFGFFVRAVAASSALTLAPLPLAALLVVLAMIGWATWSDPLGVRVLAVLVGYAVVIALFARPDTFYWAFLVAPLVPLGLVFVPDAAADLVRRALDRRRITVQISRP